MRALRALSCVRGGERLWSSWICLVSLQCSALCSLPRTLEVNLATLPVRLFHLSPPSSLYPRLTATTNSHRFCRCNLTKHTASRATASISLRLEERHPTQQVHFQSGNTYMLPHAALPLCLPCHVPRSVALRTSLQSRYFQASTHISPKLETYEPPKGCPIPPNVTIFVI